MRTTRLNLLCPAEKGIALFIAVLMGGCSLSRGSREGNVHVEVRKVERSIRHFSRLDDPTPPETPGADDFSNSFLFQDGSPVGEVNQGELGAVVEDVIKRAQNHQTIPGMCFIVTITGDDLPPTQTEPAYGLKSDSNFMGDLGQPILMSVQKVLEEGVVLDVPPGLKRKIGLKLLRLPTTIPVDEVDCPIQGQSPASITLYGTPGVWDYAAPIPFAIDAEGALILDDGGVLGTDDALVMSPNSDVVASNDLPPSAFNDLAHPPAVSRSIPLEAIPETVDGNNQLHIRIDPSYFDIAWPGDYITLFKKSNTGPYPDLWLSTAYWYGGVPYALDVYAYPGNLEAGEYTVQLVRGGAYKPELDHESPDMNGYVHIGGTSVTVPNWPDLANYRGMR